MVDRLRIAHLTPVYPPYGAGAGIACAYQADLLAARGHDVTVWTAETMDNGEGDQRSRADVRRLRAILRIGAAPLLPDLYRLPEVDVIHVHHPFIFGIEPALLAAARHRRAALVVTIHNFLVGEGLRAPLFRMYEATLGRLLTRRADRVCLLSLAHGNTVGYIRAAIRRDPERVAVVPNGVDERQFSPGSGRRVRAQLGIPEDAVVAVHTSALDAVHFLKRTDLALEAVNRAADPRLHLIVIGDGEWRERYERSAAARALAGRLHFIGHRSHDELPQVLRAGDFFLQTSDMDSFSLVLVEALACGLPAVVTDPPGVVAMLAKSEAALQAPVGDVGAIATRVREMAAMDADQRRRLGRVGRELVEDRYGLAHVVDRLESVYAAALESRRGDRRKIRDRRHA